MSDKKHIDRLFQESFKDFEAKPSDAVWENIKANLEEDKKRRIIPFWWRYAGAAALILLFLSIGGMVYNNTNKVSEFQVVDTENTIPQPKTPPNKSANDTNAISLIDNGDDVVVDTDGHDNGIKNNLNHKIKPNANNTINKTPSTNETLITGTISTKNKHYTNPNSSVIISNNLNTKKHNTKSNFNTTIAATTSSDTNSYKKLEKLEQEKGTITNANKTENTKTIADNKKALTINTDEANNAILKATENKIATVKTENEKNNQKKVPEKTDKNKRSIEDALNGSEAVVTEEDISGKRWRVAPNIAPVYFNTAGNGSSIDPQFNNNNISGDVNMSIGISTSYALNKKLSIRSGVNSVNLGYNINDVSIFQSIGRSSTSSSLKNVDTSSDQISVVSTTSLNANVISNISTTNASINQNLRYIEVPVEIQYALSNKKFGVNLIGGFSSFFLNSSKVFFEEDNGNRTILGEANNLNDLSYSANFGLGLDYKISKKLNFNLEPIFKYQFNTFNSTSGDFTPFFIGVYTGVSVKF